MGKTALQGVTRLALIGTIIAPVERTDITICTISILA